MVVVTDTVQRVQGLLRWTVTMRQTDSCVIIQPGGSGN